MREPSDRDEPLEEALDPHRREERRAAAAEVAARLRSRGVVLTGNESSEELVGVLEAVDGFERAVEFHGGDLMIDSGAAPEEPDDPAFVLPKRRADESLAAYVRRIDAATRALEARRPPRA